jgi:predicted DCC family thiol-disulfide oxidoreductase YuxK
MPQPVLLFDGECGLCRRLVLSLLRSDRAGHLRFATLQSEPGQNYLRAQGLPVDDFNTLVFVPDWNRPDAGDYKLRTDGALAAAAEAGGVWRAMSGLRVLPAWLRDPFYRLVARTRFALFGRYRPTPLPDPAWEGRFLSGW